ncbi:MAG: hypothetical protein K0R73_846 [Candidatus Midichloriaceae bacterium]|jgi:hypothetical protein|nr:hypothetical protein [Candidatus Midichloriaceae bacterium]
MHSKNQQEDGKMNTLEEIMGVISENKLKELADLYKVNKYNNLSSI